MKETPFSEAVRVRPFPGSTTHFHATIPQDWRGVPSAHGGYLQSLVFSTARAYFLTHHPSRNQPDPLTTHLQFIKQVAIGPVRLVVKPVNLGSRVSVILIEIHTPENGSDVNFKTCLLATVTQGNLATEAGITLPTIPVLKIDDLPDREKDCKGFSIPENMRKLSPGAFKLSARKPKRELRDPSIAARSVREIWYKFTDGTGFDVISLGFLTDLFPGAPNEYALNYMDYASGVIYPTLSMVTEIKKDPSGCKWLFVRLETYEIRNGRYDTNVTVVNEECELIALGKHVSLALERKTQEELKKIYRL